jgi:hypothetical protein
MPWESRMQDVKKKRIQNSWHLASAAKMDGAVAEKVRRGPPIAKTSFDSRTTRVGFMVDQVAVKVFLQIHRFSLSVVFPICSIIIIHSSMTEVIHSSQLISALNKTLPYLSLPPPPSLPISIFNSTKIHSRNLWYVWFKSILSIHVWLWDLWQCMVSNDKWWQFSAYTKPPSYFQT